MRIPVKDIRLDPAIQLRGTLDMDRVRAMQEFEDQGGHLPPVTVVGKDNLLADGFHRLEAADSRGRLDIDVDQLPGGREEAIALAIQLNDIAVSKPLTPDERGRGVRMLLEAGWTQERVAQKTGVAQATVANAATVLRMRGINIDTKPSAKAHPKARAVLPATIHEKLDDTVLVRIAGLDSVEQQAEFAAAVAAVPNAKDPTKTGLSEPRVREAIQAVKAGTPIAVAVDEATPGGHRLPSTTSDVARDVYQRLDRFLTATMMVDGVERDFWQVLDVLVHERDHLLDPTVNTLVDRLAEVATRAEHYATALRSSEAIREISA